MKRARPWLSILAQLAVFLIIFPALPQRSTDRFPSGSEIQSGTRADRAGASGRFNGDLPFSFEKNRGQADPQVKLLARGIRSSVFLTPSEVVLALHSAAPSSGEDRGAAPSVLRMSFAGGNPSPALIGEEELPGRSHYLLGSDPAQWRTNIPLVAKGRYQAVYPGVDIVFYGSEGHLEFDCVVQPDADPEAIALSFEGAEKLEIDGRGDLRVALDGGEVCLRKPHVYQGAREGGEDVDGRFRLLGPSSVAFEVTAYDATRSLVIDPTLSYSTYYGGPGGDGCSFMTEDAGGNIYFGGGINVVNFPVVRAFQPTYGGGYLDAFIAKLDASGSSIVYATYLGGTKEERAYQVAADASGNAYLVGFTDSLNFPLVNPLQSTFGGSSPGDYGGGYGDAFLTKLKPDGSGLLYSTYLGGAYDDIGMGIAVDGDGNAYVMGYTQSKNFPIKNPYQTALKAALKTDGDAFVSKISSGGALIYSTYLGGGNNEVSPGYGRGNITADTAGCAYVSGITNSPDFPLANPFQSAYGGGGYAGDAFVTKFNAAGSALEFSTYLGGSGDDRAYGIAVAPDGTVGVAGKTASTNFPTKNAFQGTFGGGDYDAFITLFNPGGSTLALSTYVGGSAGESGEAIAASSDSRFCIVGATWSSNFPLVDALQPSFSGDSDAFVAIFSSAGSSPIFSTFLGGDGGDSAKGVHFNSSGNLALGGGTGSTNFPTVGGAVQPAYGGGGDSFLARIRLAAPGPVPVLDNISPASGAAGDPAFDLTVRGSNFLDGAIVRWDGANRPTIYVSSMELTGSISAANLAAGKVINVTVMNPGGGISNAVPFSLANPAPGLTAINPASTAAGGAAFTQTVTGTKFVPNSVVRWSGKDKTTTYVSATELKAAISTADIAAGGSHQVTVYNPSPSGGTSNALTMNVADYKITANPDNASITAGQTATYQLKVEPLSGSFDTAVSLMCSGLPTLCTSSFSPASVTPGSGGSTSTLTLTTTKPSILSLIRSYVGLGISPSSPAGPAGGLLLAGLFLFSAAIVIRKRRIRFSSWLRAAAAICFVAFLAGCGGGGGETEEKKPGTPAGTYTITVNATAGTLVRQVTMTLTVK